MAKTVTYFSVLFLVFLCMISWGQRQIISLDFIVEGVVSCFRSFKTWATTSKILVLLSHAGGNQAVHSVISGVWLCVSAF